MGSTYSKLCTYSCIIFTCYKREQYQTNDTGIQTNDVVLEINQPSPSPSPSPSSSSSSVVIHSSVEIGDFQLRDDALVPLVPYQGNKTRIFPHFIHLLPNNFNDLFVVDPFCGSGSTVYQLRPQQGHLADIDQDLINLHQLTKDNRLSELAAAIEPHEDSKKHFYQMKNSIPTDQLQSATKSAYLLTHSYNSNGKSYAKASSTNPNYDRTRALRRRCDDPHYPAAWNNITVECADFADTITFYDGPDVIFLFDQPYDQTATYRHQFGDNEQVQLRLCLSGIAGLFIMIVNDTDLMRYLYKDFNMYQFEYAYPNNKGGVKKHLVIRNY